MRCSVDTPGAAQTSPPPTPGSAWRKRAPDITLTGEPARPGVQRLGGGLSLGLAAAETLFDAGASRARVRQTPAARDQAVAEYRQTVLTALQDVEDQLTATQVLARQHVLRRQASAAADQTEQIVLNQYNAGRVSYVEVVAAQATALPVGHALAQAAADRQTTAVALTQPLGGGWTAGS